MSYLASGQTQGSDSHHLLFFNLHNYREREYTKGIIHIAISMEMFVQDTDTKQRNTNQR